jgi:uncharacterized protein (UPF0332 family)
MTNSEVNELLGKAAESIAAAELLLRDGYVDFSASRSYYAMFYSVEALLLAQNLSFSKHSAVISSFGKNFIKTGLFDAKLHLYILDAFDLRNIGDYGTMHSITEQKAAELIRNAGEFLDAVRDYLN